MSPWEITWLHSCTLNRPLTGTATAPSLAAPINVRTKSTVFGIRIPTLSPRRTPSP